MKILSGKFDYQVLLKHPPGSQKIVQIIFTACLNCNLLLLWFRYLLKNNANVNAKARCGATALHFAAETGKLGVVKALIEQGNADFNITNEHGVTALLAAADR